ncbi:MAG: hypothetical protein NTX86_01000 [Candidatus Dependentiae bacterium]|nr:hypothetical protein [Candidatus Dependentiae bacterium]
MMYKPLSMFFLSFMVCFSLAFCMDDNAVFKELYKHSADSTLTLYRLTHEDGTMTIGREIAHDSGKKEIDCFLLDEAFKQHPLPDPVVNFSKLRDLYNKQQASKK